MNAAARAMDATYEDCKDIIMKTVNNFCRRYHQNCGAHRQDLLADANLDFVDAYHKWDRTRSTFPVYLRFYLDKQMLERLRVKLTRNNRLTRVNDYDVLSAPQRSASRFDVGEFLTNLSDDAKAVVQMIFETPMDVRMALLQRCSEKYVEDAEPAFVRSALSEYLRDLGWSVHGITNAFMEIQTAL